MFQGRVAAKWPIVCEHLKIFHDILLAMETATNFATVESVSKSKRDFTSVTDHRKLSLIFSRNASSFSRLTGQVSSIIGVKKAFRNDVKLRIETKIYSCSTVQKRQGKVVYTWFFNCHPSWHDCKTACTKYGEIVCIKHFISVVASHLCLK